MGTRHKVFAVNKPEEMKEHLEKFLAKGYKRVSSSTHLYPKEFSIKELKDKVEQTTPTFWEFHYKD